MSFATPGTGNPRIIAALAHMAAFRQADVGDVMLDLYAAQMTADGYGVEDVEVACERHARAERADGETAFPSLGQMRRLVDAVRNQRYLQALEADSQARQALPLPGHDMSQQRAEIWMARLKYAAKHRCSLADVVRLFPMPEEDGRVSLHD
jgi:hypothetical protein